MLNFIFNNINNFASDSLMNYLPEGPHVQLSNYAYNQQKMYLKPISTSKSVVKCYFDLMEVTLGEMCLDYLRVDSTV